MGAVFGERKITALSRETAPMSPPGYSQPISKPSASR